MFVIGDDVAFWATLANNVALKIKSKKLFA
jgi:hypothetical protein